MRRIGLVLLLVLPVLAMAQVVVTASGYATLGGPAVHNAPVSAPLIYVPQVSFVPASPSPVGASNATPGNIAGATNSTIGNIPGVSNAYNVIPVYTYGPVVPAAAPPETESVAAPSELQPLPAPAAQPQQVFYRIGDMTTDSAYNQLPDPFSIVAVARETRQRAELAGNVPTYANEDVERIGRQSAGRPGFTTATATPTAGGISGTAALDRNLGEPAGAEESAVSAPTTPSKKRAGTTKETPSVPPSNTAPERTLPDTATWLPALALLGAFAGTAGWWCHRKKILLR